MPMLTSDALDANTAMEALKKKGVSFTKEPATESWGSAAVFRDPDGNQFVLSSRAKQK